MPVTINGSAGVTTNVGAVYNGLQTGTAVASTSGTSIDFTSIPSWVKRITVMFNGVSTNGTSFVIAQLGDSGGVETASYVGAYAQLTNASPIASGNFSSGFIIDGATNATAVRLGVFTIQLLDAATNLWAAQGNISRSDTAATSSFAGIKSLSATLDRVRITTVNGTDTFDAGSINIIYE
jgi:hypothetical protein